MKKDPYFDTPEEIARYENREYVRPWFKGVFGLLDLDMNASGRSSLDVGCGFGYLAELFQENGWEAYGVDISPYAVKRAENIIPKERLAVADASKEMPFKRKFDVITCFGVLGFGSELIVSKEKLVEKCFEKLADGGVFIASAPNAQRPIILRKMLGRMETFYRNAATARDWMRFLSGFAWEPRAICIQRLPLPSIKGRYTFVKTGLGDPIVLYCRKGK